MDKLMVKSQILKLVLMAALLIITPIILSGTSLRSTYLYLIVNILIIVVGAEAGLVSFFLKSRSADHQNKRRSASAPLKVVKPVPAANANIISNSEFCPGQYDKGKTAPAPAPAPAPDDEDDDDKAVGKYLSGKNNINNQVNAGQVLKKSPSTPSIFFIDHQSGADEDDQVVFVEDNILNDEVINGQDQLFHKAETFIGNFYKQLKMQREESWKKLQDLYHKAF